MNIQWIFIISVSFAPRSLTSTPESSGRPSHKPHFCNLRSVSFTGWHARPGRADKSRSPGTLPRRTGTVPASSASTGRFLVIVKKWIFEQKSVEVRARGVGDRSLEPGVLRSGRGSQYLGGAVVVNGAEYWGQGAGCRSMGRNFAKKPLPIKHFMAENISPTCAAPACKAPSGRHIHAFAIPLW